MQTRPLKQNTHIPALSTVIPLAVATTLLLTFGATAWAQSADSDPAALGKQRTAILLKASRTPIADLESDVNHVAVMSETCRAQSGAKACGLTDKPLESNNLEDRYAYYVRRPVEAHASGRQAKFDRHNWEAPTVASQ